MFFVVQIAFAQNSAVKQFGIYGNTQGTTYAVTYYHTSQVIVKEDVDSVLKNIDLSMSLYQEGTLIKKFNNPQNTSVIMDEHMKKVVHKAFEVYELSDGIFDITIKPLTSLWGFSAEDRETLPSRHQVDSVLSFVGMHNLEVRGDTLFKKSANTQIDLDGIAQGYSVDEVARFIKEKGVRTFIVEIGGEIYTEGVKPNGQQMRIAITRPQPDSNAMVIGLTDGAVTTSGNYERYKEYKGKRISHHIDPKKGFPVEGKVISATVIAPTALEADALDNIFMYMEPAEGIELVNGLDDIELYIIYGEKDNVYEMFSQGFEKYIITNLN